jgi:hypothetical protein
MRKRSTYDAVKGNSTTAAQLADMAETGGLNEAVQFASKAATTGPINATLSWVGSRLKMLGGLTPRVADEISKKLMTTDPATVRQFTSELMKLEKARLSSSAKARVVYDLVAKIGPFPATDMALSGQQRSY